MPYTRATFRLIGSLVLLVSLACSHATEPTIPAYRVHLEVPIYAAEYQSLLSPGGIYLITRTQTEGEALGLGGLALVRSLTHTQFYAYDLACPYERRANTRLGIDGLELKCTECGSRFEVVSGTGIPTYGIARAPLRQYKVSYSPQNRIIHVTN